MKKFLIIIFTIISATSLVACNISYDNDIKEPSDVINENQKPEDQKPPKEDSKITIAETILVDEDGITITAKSLETDGLFGPQIKLLIENNSGKDLCFQCRNTSINGYMIDGIMSTTVANEKKANASLTFSESDLELCEIKQIADVELNFYIFDANDWEKYLETDAIQIRTSIADTFEYLYNENGHLVYEGNDLKIIIKGLLENTSIFGPEVVVYIENNSDKDLIVQVRNVSINNFMVTSSFSSNVIKRKRIIDTITFFDSELEENDITTIENIELYFKVFDKNNFETIVDTEIIKIIF